MRNSDTGPRKSLLRHLDREGVPIHGAVEDGGQAPESRRQPLRDGLQLDVDLTVLGDAGQESLHVVLGYQPAMRDDPDTVADPLHLRELVRGDEDRPPLAVLRDDEVPHLLDPDRIEARYGFVEEEEVGVGEQRARDAELLEHAARELAHAFPRHRREIDLLEQGSDPPPRVGDPEELGEEPQVFLRAVIQGQTPRGCFSGTTPIRVRRSNLSGVARSPKRKMSPEVGRATPSSIMIVEVLPAPLGPRKP
jgi:hypothetical protein